MYFVTPTYRPVGGVVKIFDYVNHAVSLGYEPVIACPEAYKPGLPIFEIEHFSHIGPEGGYAFTDLEKVAVGPHEFAFISWPTHYGVLEPRLSRWTRHEQVISIVQNVRWANPRWIGGYAVRLLSRPMARIMTNDVVLEAVSPYLNGTSLTEVIPLGNDSGFFAKKRAGALESPVKVGYTTWKSAVGDGVAASLAGDPGFSFRAVRNPVGWKDLRDLYHWSDVFLATPLAEEGFYMPALEAMAAGAVVVTPDAGGNMAFCRFGENCLPVGFEDVGDYVAALRDLRGRGAREIDALRRGGYEAIGRHTLEQEREMFGAFMGRLTERLEGSARADVAW